MAALFEALKEAGVCALFLRGSLVFAHRAMECAAGYLSYPFKSVFIVSPGFRPLCVFTIVRIITGKAVHVGVIFSGWMGD